MKKVLRHTQEVAHYWANAVQDEGRSGSVSYTTSSTSVGVGTGVRVSTLRSYTTPIAYRVDAADKAVMFIVNSAAGWSITTTGHLSMAARAIPRSESMTFSIAFTASGYGGVLPWKTKEAAGLADIQVELGQAPAGGNGQHNGRSFDGPIGLKVRIGEMSYCGDSMRVEQVPGKR